MYQSIRSLSSLVAIAALSSLVACGGGGGGESPAPSPTQSVTSTANTATVSSVSQPTMAVGQTVTLSWSNTSNDGCIGSGLLAGISAASGSAQVTLSTTGDATYSVTCGSASSTTMHVAVLPEYTAIKDPVFEQALVRMGVDDQVDGQVKTAAVLAVTKLVILSGTGYCSSLNLDATQCAAIGSDTIADMTGIENFRNLSYLRVEGQHFATIDLSKLSKLTFLSLWQDPITSIDLSRNTALQTLGLGETSLTTVDTSALTSLVELDVQNAQVVPYVLATGSNVQGYATLDLSKNVKLQRLYASYNSLTTLDLSHNLALTEAHLDHNQLTSVNTTGVHAVIDTSANPMSH